MTVLGRRALLACGLLLSVAGVMAWTWGTAGFPERGWRGFRVPDEELGGLEPVGSELHAVPGGPAITDGLELMEALGLHEEPVPCASIHRRPWLFRTLAGFPRSTYGEWLAIAYDPTGTTEQRGPILWAEYVRSDD